MCICACHMTTKDGHVTAKDGHVTAKDGHVTTKDGHKVMYMYVFICYTVQLLLQVFREARRVAPSVVFIPRISSWWDVTTETFQAMFLSTLHSLPSSTPILMLATSECPWGQLPAALREVFEGVRNTVAIKYVSRAQ